MIGSHRVTDYRRLIKSVQFRRARCFAHRHFSQTRLLRDLIDRGKCYTRRTFIFPSCAMARCGSSSINAFTVLSNQCAIKLLTIYERKFLCERMRLIRSLNTLIMKQLIKHVYFLLRDTRDNPGCCEHRENADAK